MNRDQVLLEEAYELVQSSNLYHGTNKKEFADGIIKDGLKYNEGVISSKYKGEEGFMPLKGAYLSKDFGNSVRYSFMPSKENYVEEIKSEPNGYVFVFSARDVSRNSPDEDELGMSIERLMKSNSKPSFISILISKLPKELINRVMQDQVNFETYALIGKYILNNNLLSSDIMNYISRFNRNVINYGVMRPIGYWVIPKPVNPHIKDRQGTFNTFNGYVSYAKRFGKYYALG